MKKFLIAGSGLVAVAAAGSAGAVDVTLGGSIGLEVEYGTKKTGGMAFGDVTAGVALKIAAAGTTDGGVKYGGSFSMKTADELKFNYYENSGNKFSQKLTVKNHTDLLAAAYNVSGGQKIPAEDIVAVKINSEWRSVSANTRTRYRYALDAMTSSDICKIAGRAAIAPSAASDHPANAANAVANHGNLAGPLATAGELAVARANASGKVITDLAFIATAAAGTVPRDGYLPAGRLTQLDSNADDSDPANGPGVNGTDVNLVLTAATSNLRSANIAVTADADGLLGRDNLADAEKGATNALDDKFNVYIADLDGDGDFLTANDANFEADEGVEAAVVYAGPFAEVKLQSSTTKMVIGAVCVTGNKASETKYYLDNVDRVVTASNAMIFVDGGFGKLTLQSSDYAGKVSAIGDAGNEANISADGVVAILEADMAGISGFAAVDLHGQLSNLEAVFGGAFDLGGISMAVDIENTNLAVVTSVASGATSMLSSMGWDLGASYSMGDGSVAVALDSGGDFGLKADMSVAGIGGSLTVYNKAEADHKKYGMFYDAALNASVNGASLGLSINQDADISGTIGYDIGNLNIYASYSGADNGGKVGAKLSF